MLEGALPPMAPVTRQNPPPAARRPDSPPPGSTLGALLLQPGTILGNRYQIIQILGEGGMGAVYKAKDLELDRVVALKVIRTRMAANPEILQRFKQELILARQITHKNVIRIFDLGEADGIKFITMEYIEGEESCHVLLRRGKDPEPTKRSSHHGARCCRGLRSRASEGVIHRDLKPRKHHAAIAGRVVVMDLASLVRLLARA